MARERILVLNVDRDNDLGEKAGVKGPLLGSKAILEAARKLGLADPTDSDVNALYQTVRMAKEMEKDYITEAAVLTGAKEVGVASDKSISTQLDRVLRKFKADYIVLVSDTSEDEHIIPLIQARKPILSISKVIVRQSDRLESGYYKIKDFLEESLENPKYSRLVFGLPAIAFLLYAFFGVEGWRAILGIIGLYLFVKGFKLDRYLMSGIGELQASLTRRRFAFFTYIVAIAVSVLAAIRGYESLAGWINIGILEAASAFTSASIFFFFIAAAIAWIGRSVSTHERAGKTIVSVVIFGFAVSLVICNAAEIIIKPDISLFNFIISIVAGFALIFAAMMLEWKK